MSKPIRLIAVLLICAVLLPASGSPFLSASAAPLAIAPDLGDATSYSVLAGTTVTSGGATVYGDLGVSPGSAVTGSPSVGPPGTIHAGDAHAAAAQFDNTAAFTFLDQDCDVTYGGVQDLTLVSPLVPGVYCAVSFGLSGTLELSGSGVWIFKSSETLITSPSSSVTGGDACNVWWRVGSSATLDTNTAFRGNILALTSIGLNSGASLKGRALAQTGAVTLANSTVSDCSSPTAISMREFQATSAAGSPFGLGAGAALLLAVGLIVVRRRVQATSGATPSARQGQGK